MDAAAHPIRLSVSGGLERSRLLVFFRPLLALAHIIWLVLWGIAAYVVAIIGWFAALFTGRMPRGLRKMGLVCLNYLTQTYAYALLLTDQYPCSGPVLPGAPQAGLDVPQAGLEVPPT